MALTSKEKSVLQKEVVDILKPYPKGLLLLAPRVGKTKIIIDLIKRDKYESILWVTPSAELAEKDIPEEFIKWKAKRYIKKLTTSTYASLPKVKGEFDIIILDENQYLTERGAKNLFDKTLTSKALIGMTGTSTQHFDKIEMFNKLSLKSLYDISINKAVDIGLLSDYEINVIKVPLSDKKDYLSGPKNNMFTTSEKKNYEYLSKKVKDSDMYSIKFKILNRMRAIKNSPSKLEAVKSLLKDFKEERTLIFCGSIKQAEDICEYTYHSKTNGEDLISFKEGGINRLSLVNAGGTGHTFKKVKNLVMIQTDSDKNGISSQKISRALLSQKGHKALIWVICLEGTQDEKWVESTLRNFDSKKINYLKWK